MNIMTVDDINILAKNTPEKFVKSCEEKFRSMVLELVKIIDEKKIKYVFLCGPTSSGKTTFASLLVENLRGKDHFDISLDDYYKTKDNMPRRTNNDYNFETINSLRLDDIKKDFNALKNGEEVFLPRVDFSTGQWMDKNEKVKIKEDTVVLIEGLHALNKKITGIFKGERILKIFICPCPSIERNGKLISPYDLRFIRRAVRDSNYRNSEIFNSFRMWGDVRQGEIQFMAKYKGNADIIENTFLNYEPCILKKPALKMLYQVEKGSPYYLRAKRIINILEGFCDIDINLVDKNSLLNEFIKRED